MILQVFITFDNKVVVSYDIFIQLLGERHGSSLMRFLEAVNKRHDLTDGLRSLKCRTLIFVGDQSPFHSETLHMVTALDRKYSALVEVCGLV